MYNLSTPTSLSAVVQSGVPALQVVVSPDQLFVNCQVSPCPYWAVDPCVTYVIYQVS